MEREKKTNREIGKNIHGVPNPEPLPTGDQPVNPGEPFFFLGGGGGPKKKKKKKKLPNKLVQCG